MPNTTIARLYRRQIERDANWTRKEISGQQHHPNHIADQSTRRVNPHIQDIRLFLPGGYRERKAVSGFSVIRTSSGY